MSVSAAIGHRSLRPPSSLRIHSHTPSPSPPSSDHQETTAEDLTAFLESDDFRRLEAQRAAVGELRSQTLRIATEAYARVDDDIQVLGAFFLGVGGLA